jgi:hypothetical protein
LSSNCGEEFDGKLLYSQWYVQPTKQDIYTGTPAANFVLYSVSVISVAASASKNLVSNGNINCCSPLASKSSSYCTTPFESQSISGSVFVKVTFFLLYEFLDYFHYQLINYQMNHIY